MNPTQHSSTSTVPHDDRPPVEVRKVSHRRLSSTFCRVNGAGTTYWTACLCLLVTVFLTTGPGCRRPARAKGSLTFTKDIAPIVLDHCAICHRPGESAPFALTTFEEVHQHASQIVEVTASGFMPPWLPEPGHARFVGERRLTANQIRMIRQWTEEGLVKGDAKDLPELPQWTDGWQLGQPDLVVTLAEPYTLPASGTDVFRNFVLPTSDSGTRYVKAVELRPGNKQVVHHAVIKTDRTRLTRQLDGQDPEPGFSGMDMGNVGSPDGQFLGWTPGKLPGKGGPGTSWNLYPKTDIVLQLHMLPSGKPEPIQPTIGLFFDDQAPTGPPAYLLHLMGDHALDIPPGAKDFQVNESFTLPVDVQLVLVYPHAHLLGRRIEASALLPDGTRKELIRINHWDFYWQDSYRYVTPIRLPQKTVVSFCWTYDNSSDNVHNPNNPPQRVGRGVKSSDEMAHLYLQVLVDNDRDRLQLQIAECKHILENSPRSWAAHHGLGAAQQSLGDDQEAIRHYRLALQIKPQDASTHFNLAISLRAKGELDQAIKHYREAIRHRPDHARQHQQLAAALQARGMPQASLEHWGHAIRLKPRYAKPYIMRGDLLAKLKNYESALSDYERAVQLKPDEALGYNHLAWLLATCADTRIRDGERAVFNARRACELYGPDNFNMLDTLAASYAQAGDFASAVKSQTRALELAPASAKSDLQERQKLYQAGKVVQ